MQRTLTFEQLRESLKPGFDALERSLSGLAVLYDNLPVEDSEKRNINEQAHKVKSAWYACLVNGNIDELLLPEYIENKQSRNILIKKETDQYFSSVADFKNLQEKRDAELYEQLLHPDTHEPANAFDLFSGQAKEETSKCPPEVAGLFETYRELIGEGSELEYAVHMLYALFHHHDNSFSGQRQCVLALNYRLWKQFGQVSLMLCHEQYLFHQWQRKSQGPELLIKGLLDYWSAEILSVTSRLKESYKAFVNFTELKPAQKIISNYLFSSGFSIKAPVAEQHKENNLLGILYRKGWIGYADFMAEADKDKSREVINSLLVSGFLQVQKEERDIFLCLDPSYAAAKGRLDQYNNLEKAKLAMDWEAFMGQQPERAPVPKASILNIPVPEVKSIATTTTRRRKAFFG